MCRGIRISPRLVSFPLALMVVLCATARAQTYYWAADPAPDNMGIEAYDPVSSA